MERPASATVQPDAAAPVPLPDPAWLDLLAVLGAAALFYTLSIRFELAEHVNAWTHLYEHWQLDELPLALLVLSAGLCWFGWRRWRALRREMQARSAMEQQNHRLAQQLIALQESERRHIARELHDEFGQYCVAIKVDAALIARAAKPHDALHHSAQRISETSDHLHDVLRGMLTRLRPMGLDDLGLVSSLELLVQDWQARHGIACSFAAEGTLDALDEARTMTIYRSVQEGLTNIARHARASRASVHLAQVGPVRGPRQLAVTVQDNGVGPTAATAQGLGLVGMRERVSALGGQCSLRRLLEGGTQLQVLLPLAA